METEANPPLTSGFDPRRDCKKGDTMSRPLPRCGLCGESLAYKARIILQFYGLKGIPEIGWCFECGIKDDVCQPRTGSSVKMLKAVYNRDKYGLRVISRHKRYEKGGACYIWDGGWQDEWDEPLKGE